MNILVVAPRFPYPLDKGDRLTIYHLLRLFSARHTVSLVCFLEPEQDPAWVEKVAPFCKRVITVPLSKTRAYRNSALSLFGSTPMQLAYYADPHMMSAVRQLVQEEQPDLLYAHTIRMGQYIERFTDIPRVLAMQISMTLNYRRLAEQAHAVHIRVFHELEYRKVRAFEGRFAQKFDKVLLISPHDLAAIETDRPEDNVFFSPHGVDFEYFSQSPDVDRDAKTIIFTGNMNYAPNIDAARYFYEDIWPVIKSSIPDATWNIVGADPAPIIKAMGEEAGIHVTGRVPDLRTYMDRSTIAIDPLRVGAGLQNKVLEGMSMGLPMVITSVANEGIQATHGKDVIIADTPDAFASAVVAILQNPSLQLELGRAARKFIVDCWSWEKHFLDLEEMFTELSGASAFVRH